MDWIESTIIRIIIMNYARGVGIKKVYAIIIVSF